jgi:osmoprotectant transport system permease protein
MGEWWAEFVQSSPFLRYLMREQTRQELIERTGQHLSLVGTAMLIALLIALPLGVLVARWKKGGDTILGVLGILYTIPSLALLVLLIPLVGLGFKAAIITLVIYAQLVLVRNVAVGLRSVDPAVIEAARGMGMSAWERLRMVEVPIALPIIIAGVRIAALSTIAIATVASLINAGGLGRTLFEGVSQGNKPKVIVGALAVSLLAIIVDQILRLMERLAQRRLIG